ncbi:alpha/beta-Hydrolases superfamily protein [Thalictrum thalictroides]|uniref:Alpha/beta-Hydrolases superfamily protein n=1 Tax=Thalictrum thalictroides TaxID=46969 RepID=A0A7J6W8L9_THATH|nr:alpha/beta-Hydrolases superfamily protein [Thalictrum thalictroides]
MPFCEINKYHPIGGLNLHKNTAIKIFYRTYGNGPIKVLLIIGLAGTHESWGPQIKGLTGDDGGDVEFQNINEERFQLCAFDNRGMGRSSVPTKKSEYTTTIMAKDTIALMDHLGWRKAHVFGHSMGAMIACKLAAMAPDRILSLALLNVTGGGFECLAGTHESWGPQIKGLTGDDGGDVEFQNINEERFQLCAFDNRGMGRSSVPTKKSEYTTTIMAKDTIALMDHLGWRKAHVFGHSMGAMIACKLAAMAPDRILSLALLNVTGGGFECFPKIDRKMISIAIRFLKAKTPEERAAVDLDTHYTKEYLDEHVGPHTRRTILYQEYVKGISSSGMQSSYGFEGQINACWTHKVTYKELEVIRSAGFLISVIHGRYDIIAQMYYARKLAEKLQPYAKMIDLHGGHLVSHERPEEVNEALVELIKASELKLSPQDWSNLPRKGAGSQVIGIQILSSSAEDRNCRFFLDILRKLQLMLLYMLGVFVMAFDYGWKIVRRPKASRVETSVS